MVDDPGGTSGGQGWPEVGRKAGHGVPRGAAPLGRAENGIAGASSGRGPGSRLPRRAVRPRHCHPAGWGHHFWINEKVPEVSLLDPEAEELGVRLPREAFWYLGGIPGEGCRSGRTFRIRRAKKSGRRPLGRGRLVQLLRLSPLRPAEVPVRAVDRKGSDPLCLDLPRQGAHRDRPL